MSAFRFVLCIGIVAATVKEAPALSEEQKKFISKAIETRDFCSKKIGVTNEEVQKALSAGYFAPIDPCYFDCLYKKMGILNYQGKYDVKVAKEYSTTFLEDEEELRKIYFIFKECVAVKDEKVIYKGCDRGKFIALCFDKLRVMKMKKSP